jgi:hypothetical protein
MMHQQNGPPGVVWSYQQMARLSIADQKITISAVHKVCGFDNTPPDQAANSAAIVPFGINFVFAKQVDGYLAVALSSEYAIENE